MADYQPVCHLSDLEEDKGYGVVVHGRPLALFLHQGRVYALEDRCPHREGQLSRGRVERGEAICPLHGWNFDLQTGISPYNPLDRIATYPARLEGEQVCVDFEAVPPLPPQTFDGYQGRWRRWHQDSRGHQEVRQLAKGKPKAIEAMGAPKPQLQGPLDFDHLHLAAAQLDRLPKLAEEPVSTATVLGRGAGKALQLAMPAYISHMSFGALSREAKIALAQGAARAGTLIGSGEGGMQPEERAAAGLYILEMASGYFGWQPENIERADALEIKLGQSAKPGLGGELPGVKVTAEIAKVRGLQAGEAALSPARFPDIENLEALGERIDALRRRWPDKPIGLKFAANRLQADLEAALQLEPDFITLDGFGGGTGAAPIHVRDQVGMTLVSALPIAHRRIERHNREHPQRPVSLVATGGIRTPADVAKALALGADACALATASLFALGCEYYRACNSGECPVGIATHKPELRARLDIAVGAERVANFYQGLGKTLEDYLRLSGREHCGQWSLEDLIPLSPEAAQLLAAHAQAGH